MYKLSGILKKFQFNKLLIFYPSIRIYISAKLAGIKNIYIYNFFKKKNLHLTKAAKKLTENFLKINECPTETSYQIDKNKILDVKNKYKGKFKIVIGVVHRDHLQDDQNYSYLINKLNQTGNYYFFIYVGQMKEVE